VGRLTATVTASLALLVLTAGPVLAQDGDAGVRGTFGGVALALALGTIFGVAVVFLAYKDVAFGEDEAHAEHAHDIRDGVAAHEPGIDEPVAAETQAEDRGAP
jgi:hypothetical protein